MVSLTQILVLAIVAEAIVNTVKLVYDKEKRTINPDVIIALVVGILVAVVVNVDLLVYFGFTPAVPYVGAVLMGIVISRGANFVHELIKVVQELASPSLLVK